MTDVLKVDHLTSGYGKRKVILDVNVHLGQGELVAIVGPNGSGKSTLIGSLVNLVARFDGDVMLEGNSVVGLRSHEFVAQGMTLVTQTGNIFPDLSIADHFRLARIGCKGRASADVEAKVLDAFPRLTERWKSIAGVLSGGERQMLAAARALVTAPTVLLLDEPSKGLAPQAIDALLDTVLWARDELGVSTLIAEQDVEAVGRVCSRYYLLKVGKVAQAGPIGPTFRDELASAYLV